MKRTLAAIFSVAFSVVLMTGCSSVQVVESQVSAFYSWGAAPPAPATPYRFERLPSQQVVGAQQDTVEGLARGALARVGLELSPATARYSVQVTVATQVIERAPYNGDGYDGFGFSSPGFFPGGGSRGALFGPSFPTLLSDPYYRRELTLLMRDLGSGQVVFETHAVSDGVQYETLAVLAAMLDAALNVFPQPPAGPRQINIPINAQIPR